MSTPKPTQEFLNKRRMLVFFPLPGFICLTVLFYLGGGGRGADVVAGPVAGDSGINRTLPSVGKTVIFSDKMQAYRAPAEEGRRRDLAFEPVTEPGVLVGDSVRSGPPTGLNYAVQPGQSAQRYDPQREDPNVVAVQSRMQRLQQQTATPAPAVTYATPSSGPTRSSYASSARSSSRDEQMDEALKELDQLKEHYQKRLAALNAPATAPPAGTVASAPAKPKKGMSVVTRAPRSVVSRLDQRTAAEASTPVQNGFHTVGEEHGRAELNAVPAVVHSDQVVTQGSVVKLRLLEDVQLEGRLIPRNSFLYGTCNVSGNRLTITATTVQYQGSLLPLSLKAYDIDGGEGLNIPGSIDRDGAKQGLAAGVGSADVLTMSPSLGAQAAGIAIQTGKALTGRKIKLVKIHLKANYQLLLKS